MNCDDARTQISAELDGEGSRDALEETRAHLLRCAECRAWRDEAIAVHRIVRVTDAPAVPDLVPTVLAAVRELDDVHSTRKTGLRVMLAVVAIIQIAVAIPALILGDDAGLPVHTARHLGSFAVALGVGFLFAAWKPERAAGVLPIAAAVVLLIVATSIVDTIGGRAQAMSELGHATEVVGVVALWLMGHVSGSSARSGPQHRPAPAPS